MIANNLHVANTGHQPTFVTATRAERLDVTITNTQSLGMVTNWHVDQTESLSDHKYINFKILTTDNNVIRYRNKKKTNWEIFKNEMENTAEQLVPMVKTTTHQLDEAVENITNCIQKAYHKACPLKEQRE